MHLIGLIGNPGLLGWPKTLLSLINPALSQLAAFRYEPHQNIVAFWASTHACHELDKTIVPGFVACLHRSRHPPPATSEVDAHENLCILHDAKIAQ